MIIESLDVIVPVVLVIYLIIHFSTKKSESTDSEPPQAAAPEKEKGYQPSNGMRIFLIMLVLLGACLSLMRFLVETK
jgi:hypothetical protein